MVLGWFSNVLSYFLNIFKHTGQYIDFDFVTFLSTSVCIIHAFVMLRILRTIIANRYFVLSRSFKFYDSNIIYVMITMF